ncbi:MAG TPA: hypothetical protein VEK13_03100 [Thermoplasmata archaeon]|nr:hypothetical protein [Thermoplasmata archaeon]
MRPSRVVLLLWSVVIAVLLGVEFAEITHVFTVSIQSAVEDPLAFVFALVFTTVLALVGAIFIGIYFTQRLLSPAGFTPFEEEMLRMRSDLAEVKEAVRRLSEAPSPQSASLPAALSDPVIPRPPLPEEPRR